MIVFTVCQERFVTNLLTYITNFVTRVTKFLTCVTKFVTKTLLYERKNYLADSKNYLADIKNNLADNENYLADSGARNGLLGEGVVKDVCRKYGQLSQEMDDQFQDKTQPFISDGFEAPTIHSQPV